MNATTKPATPLPWQSEQIGVTDAGPNGIDVFDLGPCDKEGAMRVRVATVAGDDAAYIVAACNAYPELVAALRACGWYLDLPECESIPHESLRTMDAEQQLDFMRDTVRALLAKLGESA